MIMPKSFPDRIYRIKNKYGIGKQHDSRSGGIKKVGHAAFLPPYTNPVQDKWNSPFSKFESNKLF
jgi:hypothetical protein